MPPLPAFDPHFDVLSVAFLFAFVYEYANRRLRPLTAPSEPGPTTAQRWSWHLGVFSILVASWWPVHDLAEESMITFHMLEHLILGYVTPVLLLRGMNRWFADWSIGRRAIARLIRPFANPVTAFFFFNVMIVFVHWPEMVAIQNTNEAAHLLLHFLLFASGVALWLPIFSPTPAFHRISEPMQVLYLFLTTIVPIVPASFLTFSSKPLYPVYLDAYTRWGIDPLVDQTMAGILMKLGAGFYLLGMGARIWFAWSNREQSWDEIERELVETK